MWVSHEWVMSESVRNNLKVMSIMSTSHDVSNGVSNDITESWVSYEWVMSESWVSQWAMIRVSHDVSASGSNYVGESCQLCEWDMSIMWVSHVNYISASCLLCGWVSEQWREGVMSHVTESRHIWMHHVKFRRFMSRMNE